MDYIISILKNHWELIVSVLLFILSFILQLFKKKPLNALNGILIEWCIDAVKLAEKTDVKGVEKLTVAVQYVLGKLHDIFPTVKDEEYLSFVVNQIEDILSTPQKKKNG